MILFQWCIPPSPTVGRNFFADLKSLDLLGYPPQVGTSQQRKLTERSAKPTLRDVENPWNSFAGCSL